MITRRRRCKHQAQSFVHQTNPDLPAYGEWVHSDPDCLLPVNPGKCKSPIPTTGWSTEHQRDLPLETA